MELALFASCFSLIEAHATADSSLESGRSLLLPGTHAVSPLR